MNIQLIQMPALNKLFNDPIPKCIIERSKLGSIS
jgi:hypothetical protein